jgi:hypothetical protein
MKIKIYFLALFLVTIFFVRAQTPADIQRELISRIPLYEGVDNCGGHNIDLKNYGPIKSSHNTIRCLELSSLKLLQFMAAHPEYYKLRAVDTFTEDYLPLYPPSKINAYPANKKDIEFGLETIKNFPKGYSAKVHVFQYSIIINPSLDSIIEGNNPAYYFPGAAAYGTLFGNNSPGGNTETFNFWNKTWLGWDFEKLTPFTVYVLVFTEVQRKNTKIRTDIPLTLPVVTVEFEQNVITRTGFKLLWPSNADKSAKVSQSTQSKETKIIRPANVPITAQPTKEKVGQRIISESEVEIIADTTVLFSVYDDVTIDSDAVSLETYGVTVIDPTEFVITGKPRVFTVEPGTYIELTVLSEGKVGNECTVAVKTRFGYFTLRGKKGGEPMTIYVGAP